MACPITCYACRQRIAERADDIVLVHRLSGECLFFHDDGRVGKCTTAAFAMRNALGASEWRLVYRPYQWTAEEAEGLAA